MSSSKMNRRVVIAAVLCVAVGIASAKEGGPYYYASFKTKSLPEVPRIELTEKEALARPSYYVVHYTPAGQLQRFSKYLHGKLQWESRYVYSSAGQLQSGSTVSEANGRQVRVEYVFDSSGKLATRRVVDEKSERN